MKPLRHYLIKYGIVKPVTRAGANDYQWTNLAAKEHYCKARNELQTKHFVYPLAAFEVYLLNKGYKITYFTNSIRHYERGSSFIDVNNGQFIGRKKVTGFINVCGLDLCMPTKESEFEKATRGIGIACY
jgi:hypothetical protein